MFYNSKLVDYGININHTQYVKYVENAGTCSGLTFTIAII